MSNDFDPNWPHGHQTRDGRKARVIPERLAHPTLPVIAAVIDSAGSEHVYAVTHAGRFYDGGTNGNDLLNSPAPVRVWEGWAVLIDGFQWPHCFASEVDAAKFAAEQRGRVAPVRIEFPPEEPAMAGRMK
jgi:hypothetical protein